MGIDFTLELDRFCGGPAWDVSFHRLCQVWHEYHQLRAEPFPVRLGDCFVVELHPPTPIEPQDTDEIAMLAQQPRLQPQQQAIMDNPEAVHIEALVNDDDEGSIDDDDSVGAFSLSVIIFTKDREGIVGRIDPYHPNGYYGQAASMIGIPINRLLMLYEVPSPPIDLRESHDRVWIANRLGDIHQGSIGKLVLLDVKFCDTLPRLDPEVVRQVKLIVTPMTRKTLLQVLGLHPYCEEWPCLIHLNHNFVPQVAPFSIRHGDYIAITISPPEPTPCASTRHAVLALHHGLGKQVLPNLGEHLQEHMDISQVPNPDVDLIDLEFDYARVELRQAQVTLHKAGGPIFTSRLDESDEIRRRIDETAAANELLQEEVIPGINTDDLPTSLQRLIDPWNEIATTWFGRTRWAAVGVWYISHLRWRICTSYQIVWLSENAAEWEARILDSWADQIDQDEPVEIAVVRPEVHRREPNLAAHIILAQHQTNHEEHAALVTLQDDGFHGRIDRQAMVLPTLVTHENLLVVSNRLQDCLGRPMQLRCRTRSGSFELTHEAMVGWTGCSYTVLIERLAQMPAAPFAGDQIFPVAIAPNAPQIIRDIHSAILYQRATQPHQPINLRIMSWFLDHARFRTCIYGRNVDLPLDPNQWMLAIIHQWPDQYDPQTSIDGFLVRPTPSTRLWQVEDVFHVIVHQRPMPRHSSVLITTFDQTRGARDPPGIQRAAVVPATLTIDDVLRAADLDQWCQEGETRQCTIQYGPLPIAPGTPLDCSSSFSFRAFLSDAPPPRWEHPIEPETDEVNFLQLSKFLSQQDQSNHKTPEVDLADAVSLHEALDAHYFLPSFDLPRPSAWHPSCYAWLDLNWWEHDEPIYDLWVYYDGSYYKEDTPRAGGAVVAFVATDTDWKFAGAVSTALPKANSSYQAELWTAIIALKFSFDLLKTAHYVQGWFPCLHLCFDAQTIGKQADGSWAVKALPREAARARSLYQWLEAVTEQPISSWHIPGHEGEPGNEIVDHLAKLAAEGKGLHSLQDWLDFLFQRDWDVAFPWLWKVVPLPVNIAQSCSTQDLRAEPPLQQVTNQELPCNEEGKLRARFGTCNVLTLKPQGPRQQETGVEAPSRLAYLLRQAKEARLTIFAMQETRVRRAHHGHTEDFFLFRSTSTDRGHYGMLLAFAKTHALGCIKTDNRQQTVFFEESDFAVITARPRLLIVRIHNKLVRAIAINAHAPHTGAGKEEIDKYWKEVHEAVPPKYDHWDVILLTDANARVGQEPSQSIGTFQAEAQDDKSEAFCTFVHDHGLFLPSTFAEFHVGAGGTWRHPGGSWHRNDYVAIPSHWRFETCSSWIDDGLDPSLIKDDHKAAVVDCVCTVSPFGRHRPPVQAKLHPKEIPGHIWPTMLFAATDFDHLDVTSHAVQLEQLLVAHLKPFHCPEQRKPRKESISESTWQLVCEKKSWRAHLQEAQTLYDRIMLQSVFTQWSNCATTKTAASLSTTACKDLHQQIKEADFAVAQAWQQFSQLRREVVRAIRTDDIRFYDSLLQEGADHLKPGEAKQLWKVVRRSLPKHRQRKLQPPPLQLEALEDKWLPHFEQIEAGMRIDLETLYQACHTRHQAQMQNPAEILLSDLPTLQQFETALRAVKPGKATGLDRFGSEFYHHHAVEIAKLFHPLILKIFQFQIEPANWKGGIMAVLPKVGDPHRVSQFRGIMLLNTVAKAVHSLLRARLLPVLACDKPPGQIGGFPNQEVMFGSQFVQMFGKVASSHNFSTGVLFLDLQQAFHRLIREAVVGIESNHDFSTVLRALEQEQHPTERVQALLQLPCVLERLNAPKYLIKILRDVHIGTWFTIDRHRCTQTHRGTRPGSPLADIVFHAIMREASTEIQQWLDDHEGLQALLQQMNIQLSPVVWADDIAIPVCAAQPADLVPLVTELLVFVLQIFQDKGFKLNLAHGKTAAVLTFRGPKAPQFRKEFLLVPQPGVECILPDGSQVWLHFEHTYRHLGTQYASDQTLATELMWRTGQASSAFQQLSRPLLTNKHLPEYLRLRMFKALVATRLFFGAGAWHTPTLRQMHKLRTTWTRLLRRTLRINTANEHIPNLEVCLKAGEADIRAKLAYERLLYAQRFFAQAPAHVHHLAHVEFGCTPNSWLHGLRADLVWLQELVPGRIPITWTTDFTEPIEFWQSGGPGWKSILKDAWRRHQHQERIILEAQSFHHQIFQIWFDAGAAFSPSPFDDNSRLTTFKCSCGRGFTTAQGLATHRWKIHQCYSPEYQYLTEATCAHCLKFFWTTQRLRQHLAYIYAKGWTPQWVLCSSFTEVWSPALCQGWFSQIGARAWQKGEFAGRWPHQPVSHQAWDESCVLAGRTGQMPGGTWSTACPCQCWEKWGATSVHSHGAYQAMVSSLGWKYLPHWPWWQMALSHGTVTGWLPPMGGEDLFILGQQHLTGYHRAAGAWRTGVHPRWSFFLHCFWVECIRRADWFAGRLAFAAEPPPIQPHRPIRRGTANDSERAQTHQHVPRLYGEQAEWQTKLRQCQLDFHPPEALTPLWRAPTPMPTFLVAHLFSGRRRAEDCHAQLDKYAAQMRIRFVILSLDTANSIHYGNLEHKSVSWSQLQRLYARGHVAASICGSPCETFTEARFQAPPEGAPHPERWPRSAARLFGLDGLSHRELRQLRTGSAFFLQVMQVLSRHVTMGGLFVAEHPAPPRDKSRPSIWASALVETFLALPELRLFTVKQSKWGARAPKPTGLLALRLPYFIADLHQCAAPTPDEELETAIGLDDETGQFRTAKYKEYPPAFCAGIANVIAAQLRRNWVRRQCRATEPDSDLLTWVNEAAQASKEVRANAQFLPDYQGQWRKFPSVVFGTYPLIREFLCYTRAPAPFWRIQKSKKLFLFLLLLLLLLFVCSTVLVVFAAAVVKNPSRESWRPLRTLPRARRAARAPRPARGPGCSWSDASALDVCNAKTSGICSKCHLEKKKDLKFDLPTIGWLA